MKNLTRYIWLRTKFILLLHGATVYSTAGIVKTTNNRLHCKYAFRGSVPAFGAVGQVFCLSEKKQAVEGEKIEDLRHLDLQDA